MSEHIAPRSLYYTIFAALMVLTALTVWIAYLDLGLLNLPVALAIAVTKATIVVLYFMHLRWSERLTHVTLLSAFVFFGLLVFFTLSDYLTRGWLGVPGR